MDASWPRSRSAACRRIVQWPTLSPDGSLGRFSKATSPSRRIQLHEALSGKPASVAHPPAGSGDRRFLRLRQHGRFGECFRAAMECSEELGGWPSERSNGRSLECSITEGQEDSPPLPPARDVSPFRPGCGRLSSLRELGTRQPILLSLQR